MIKTFQVKQSELKEFIFLMLSANQIAVFFWYLYKELTDTLGNRYNDRSERKDLRLRVLVGCGRALQKCQDMS